MLATLLMAVTTSTAPAFDQVRAARMQHLSAVAAQISTMRRTGMLGPPQAARAALSEAVNRSMQKAAARRVLTAAASAQRPSAPISRKVSRLASADTQTSDGMPTDPIPTDARDANIIVKIQPVAPQSDAVAHICGSEATICSVWWPTALGDAARFHACSQQPDNPSENFGQTREEYCSMTYGGDCDGAAPQGPNADLCSLVHGMAVRWDPVVQYGDFVSWGDCSHFIPVKELQQNLIGLGVDYAAAPPPNSSDSTADSTVEICAGTVYLLFPQ